MTRMGRAVFAHVEFFFSFSFSFLSLSLWLPSLSLVPPAT